ncbi:MAG TPA: ABC transporter permease [Dongiaceae bacterium]|jgi:ribose transport system permease protein|nr:ABC transporter permease [Dongiaceae bacterium]
MSTSTITSARRRVTGLRRLSWNGRVAVPTIIFAVVFTAFGLIHPRGISVITMTPWADQQAALGFAAAGQFMVVVTRGLDLSVGSVLALSNAVGSVMLNGSPLEIAGGMAVVLAVGALCGLLNGVAVVYGRVVPIIATLSTGAIYSGLALWVRPTPGGDVAEILNDLFTNEVFGVIPTSLVLLFGVVYAIWSVLSRTILGRSLYAIGSSEAAAYMSGLRADQVRLVAYMLSGFFAACGGLFLNFQTLSGDASVGASYTLNSIAAVVIGGASLAGGVGTVWGSILGAFVLRTIGAIMIFTSLPALAQPLFEGTVLLLAVSFSAIELVRAPNKLKALP